MSGIVTLPVAIYGYIFFPDTLQTTTAFHLSEEEKELARQRVPVQAEGESAFSRSFIPLIVRSWYFYGFVFLCILGNCSESPGNQQLFNQYLKAHPTMTFTVYQLNNYPIGLWAAGVLSTLLWALSTDIWGKRWLSGYYTVITSIGCAAILLVPGSPTAAHFGAYYWSGTIYCIQATFFAWANDSMRNQPPALRACVIACMNAGGNAFQAFWPLAFYRADDAPQFTVGQHSTVAACPVLPYPGTDVSRRKV